MPLIVYYQHFISKMILNKHFYRIDDYSKLVVSGENKREIALIVLQEDYNKHQELLEKIMGSVKLDMAKDLGLGLIAEADKRIQIQDYPNLASSKHLFLFGLGAETLSLQFNLKAYHPVRTEMYILHPLDSLKDLSSDVNKKKILWGYLKKVFK